jgi:hypothetical protein
MTWWGYVGSPSALMRIALHLGEEGRVVAAELRASAGAAGATTAAASANPAALKRAIMKREPIRDLIVVPARFTRQQAVWPSRDAQLNTRDRIWREALDAQFSRYHSGNSLKCAMLTRTKRVGEVAAFSGSLEVYK